MAAITVRGLDEGVRHRLKVRAATNNRSMEAEVRAILTLAVSTDPTPSAPGAREGLAPPTGAREGLAPPSGVPAEVKIRQVLQASGLTAREQAVVVHVAQGMTNRQIAGLLFLSERTVEAHVGSVLHKLGYASRASVAGWYAAMSAGHSDRAEPR